MTGKDLKKLGRSQLLERMVAQGRELEEVRERLAEAEARLEERKLVVNEAGSIAEAALALNGVFEAAEAASAQYMENIRELSERQQRQYAQWEEENKKKADEILEKARRGAEVILNSAQEERRRLEEEAREQCRILEEETRRRCERMLNSPQQKADDGGEESYEE